MSLPSISVVIPLYNHQRYITAALYSVIDQTHPPKEVIVVDDGSSDNSAAIVAAIAEARPEIVFWTHPNRGASNTINAGIHRASGDLIAILNSDDMYTPTRLERVAKAFVARPEADVVATRLAFMDGEGAAISCPWFDNALAFYHQCNNLGIALVNGNFFMTTSNIVVRRQLFNEIGYFSDLRYAHDLDFFLRLVLRRKIIEFIDEELVIYRLHDNNTIKEGQSKVKIEWAATIGVHLFLLSSSSSSPTRWSEAVQYMDVLRKHELTELVFMFLTYFQSHGVEAIERNEWSRDELFVSALRDVRQ